MLLSAIDVASAVSLYRNGLITLLMLYRVLERVTEREFASL